MSLNCQLTFVLNLHDQLTPTWFLFGFISKSEMKWKKNYNKKIRNENEQYENKMNIKWKQKQKEQKIKRKWKKTNKK